MLKDKTPIYGAAWMVYSASESDMCVKFGSKMNMDKRGGRFKGSPVKDCKKVVPQHGGDVSFDAGAGLS